MAKLNFSNTIAEDLKTAASDSFIDSLKMIEVAKLEPCQQRDIIETMPDISHKEVKEIQKKSPSKPKKEKSAPPVSKVEEVSEEIEDTEDNGDSVPDNSVIEIVSDRYKPCLLSESEIAALSRYITQLLELASDTDYEVISALADKLRR